MQGTVSAFDADTRGGRVLLDDGVELPFAAEALDGQPAAAAARRASGCGSRSTGDGAALRVDRLQILTLH